MKQQKIDLFTISAFILQLALEIAVPVSTVLWRVESCNSIMRPCSNSKASQPGRKPGTENSQDCFFFLSNTNDCSRRNNKKQEEMTVLTEHGQTGAKNHNHLLPEAIPENFRFISCDYNTESTENTMVSWQLFNLEGNKWSIYFNYKGRNRKIKVIEDLLCLIS